jgi:hypothetical protein
MQVKGDKMLIEAYFFVGIRRADDGQQTAS